MESRCGMSIDIYFRDSNGLEVPAAFDRDFPYLPSYHYYRDHAGVLAFSVSSSWHGVPFLYPFEGGHSSAMIKCQFIALDTFLRTGTLPESETVRQSLRSLRDLLYYAAERGYSADAC